MTAPATRFRAAPFGALWACYFGSLGLFNPYSPLWLSQLGYSTLAIGSFIAVAGIVAGSVATLKYMLWNEERSV